jgi:uncharacterized protein
VAEQLDRTIAMIDLRLEADAKLSGGEIQRKDVPTFSGTQARVQKAASSHPRPEIRRAELNGSGDLTKRQLDILRVLAEFEAIGRKAVSKNWVAARAGVSNTSGGYFNNLGKLRSAGLIDYDGQGGVILTDSGRSTAPQFEPPTSSDEMLASCLQVLNARQQDILKAVYEKRGEAIPKDELAELVGVSATSGGYFNNLGALRSAGMIEYEKGGVKAAEWIYLD